MKIPFWPKSRAPKPEAALSAAPAEAKPEPREYGITGTPALGGYLRDVGEYNPELEGLRAFSTYEKMRRSDAQVAATLMAMKLPIHAATWMVMEPVNATPVEKEATAFVRDELFEREVELDAVIGNALLMLDFGCAAHEDVWEIDAGWVRLKKLAPRLPVTFSRWLVDSEENLAALEQYGAKADSYVTATIPADKLVLFSHEQEGANFAGRSVLRPMYPHWFIKNNLYKVDAIAQERNGMGVPWIKMGPGAMKEDREAARTWLQALAVHEKTSIVLPPGWEFGLEGVKGDVRDAKDSILHHNMMISMAGLAMFMQLGQSESGNRALGETLGDFFSMALQATAKRIERALNWGTIARMVRYNFGELKRMPWIAAQDIIALKFADVQAALKDLAAAELVRPDDELEAWLRQTMGLPRARSPRELRRAKPDGQGA